jgi:hypothetical protein
MSNAGVHRLTFRLAVTNVWPCHSANSDSLLTDPWACSMA